MKTYIYAIKNLVNNKMYIGSTKSLKKRKYEHFYQLKKQIHHSYHLQQSYNKYGKDKFAFYVIEEIDSSIRKKKEVYYINKYKTFDKNFGYNIHEPNESNFKCSENTKSKMKTSEYIKNLQISVDAYTLNGEFKENFISIIECSRKFNIPYTAISQILKGKRKSYKGLTFLYAGLPFTYSSSNKQRNMSKYYK